MKPELKHLIVKVEQIWVEHDKTGPLYITGCGLGFMGHDMGRLAKTRKDATCRNCLRRRRAGGRR